MDYQVLGTVVKLRMISTVYNLKLVIDKGLMDVLKPRWITDSVEAGYTLPMTSKYALSSYLNITMSTPLIAHHRYFFHATQTRIEAEDYFDDRDDIDIP